MSYLYYNPNPLNKVELDCTVRAISIVLDKTWDEVYHDLSQVGFELAAPFVSNHVWGAYLRRNGFKRYIIPDTCPDCYTVKEFSLDNPLGVYLVATEGHVVAIKNGNYYDTWDCGGEIPIYYWKKEM